MYAKVNGSSVIVYPYDESTLQSENPNTRFNFGKSSLADLYDGTEDQVSSGCTIVEVEKDIPDYLAPNKVATYNASPSMTEGGDWVLGYTVSDRDASEVSQAETEVTQELTDKITAAKDEFAWTIAADSALSSELQSEWTAYFTALDAISDQENYPWDVTFPTRPATE